MDGIVWAVEVKGFYANTWFVYATKSNRRAARDTANLARAVNRWKTRIRKYVRVEE